MRRSPTHRSRCRSSRSNDPERESQAAGGARGFRATGFALGRKAAKNAPTIALIRASIVPNARPADARAVSSSHRSTRRRRILGLGAVLRHEGLSRPHGTGSVRTSEARAEPSRSLYTAPRGVRGVLRSKCVSGADSVISRYMPWSCEKMGSSGRTSQCSSSSLGCRLTKIGIPQQRGTATSRIIRPSLPVECSAEARSKSAMGEKPGTTHRTRVSNARSSSLSRVIRHRYR